MSKCTEDEERSILQLLAQRTKLQREVKPILERIEQINTRLQAIFAEQNRRTMAPAEAVA